MKNFLACLALMCMLPCLTDAVRCAAGDDTFYYPMCNYCGFSNITTYVCDTAIYKLRWACLDEPVMDVHGYTTNLLNKCDHRIDSQPAYYKDVKLYICDQEMCNVQCGDTPVTANSGVPKTPYPCVPTTAKNPVVSGSNTTAF